MEYVASVPPLVQAPLAALPCGARALLKSGLGPLVIPCSGWGVGCVASVHRVERRAAVQGHAYFDGPQSPDAEFLACDGAYVSSGECGVDLPRPAPGSRQHSSDPYAWLTSAPPSPSSHARPLPGCSCSMAMGLVCTARPTNGSGLRTSA